MFISIFTYMFELLDEMYNYAFYKILLCGLNAFLYNFFFLLCGSMLLIRWSSKYIIKFLIVIFFIYKSGWIYPILSLNELSHLTFTLWEGMIWIHPPFFYTALLLSFFYVIPTTQVNTSKKIQYRVVSAFCLLSFFTGGLWSFFYFTWGYYWLFDFIELFPFLFLFLTTAAIHIRFIKSLLSFSCCLVLFILFLLLLTRYGFILTRHSFFSSKGLKVYQWALMVILSLLLTFVPVPAYWLRVSWLWLIFGFFSAKSYIMFFFILVATFFLLLHFIFKMFFKGFYLFLVHLVLCVFVWVWSLKSYNFFLYLHTFTSNVLDSQKTFYCTTLKEWSIMRISISKTLFEGVFLRPKTYLADCLLNCSFKQQTRLLLISFFTDLIFFFLFIYLLFVSVTTKLQRHN